jgi:hypothetical protein
MSIFACKSNGMNAISSSGTSEFPSEGLLSTSGSYLVLVGDREIQYKLLGKMVLRNHSNSADCDILICCRLHRHQCPHEVGQTLLLSLADCQCACHTSVDDETEYV